MALPIVSDDHILEREISLPVLLEPDSDAVSDMPQTPFEPEDDVDTMKELHVPIQVPTHPIPSMQAAFAESMLDASATSTPAAPKEPNGNSAARRQQLLDRDVSEATHASRWPQKPGHEHHQLWKLMAQISFGVYLLLNGVAKDDDQVLSILQGHVDEVDEFLETTLEDFDLAQEDIDERLQRLKIPLENIHIFDGMLEDREYRLQIVNGNELIEHIITRTASAMNAALKDVQQGLNATRDFAKYLAAQENGSWNQERPDMDRVYDAMKGNADGWYKAYVSLQTKGNHLGVALVQLGSIVAEMDRRAGEISRKTRFSLSPAATKSKSPEISQTSSPPQSLRQSQISIKSLTKELPADPGVITPAIQATLPAFQYVSERERTPEPEDEESDIEDTGPDLSTFTLQPRTYSPATASAPLRIPAPEPSPPAPEVSRRSSLRARFSLKRKVVSTQPSLSKVPQQKKTDSVSLPAVRQPDPPFYSDSTRIASKSQASLDDSYFRPFPRPSPEFGSPFIQSPQSDQQHFRPVLASPHSPLQRPWTAAPVLPNSNLRNSLATTASNMSQMTTGTGNKVKKKKSGFGWLKKAFSLSEEEKAAFEERRRAPPPPVDYRASQRPIFLDGRRIR